MVEYKVYKENGMFLFSIDGLKLSISNILYHLHKRGYNKGLFDVEWKTYTKHHGRSGIIRGRKINYTKVDASLSPRENQRKFSRKTRYGGAGLF